MRDLQPVRSESSSSDSIPPPVPTITIPGPTITSTAVVTSTVVATATTYTTVTRTVTETVTTTATTVATVTAETATVATATATTTTTTTTAVEDISSEKAKLASEVDELISNLSQYRQRLGEGPVDAVTARALAGVGGDIGRLWLIKKRALEAKTPEELNQLRQELESIKSKYASLATGIVVNIDYKFYTIPENVVIVPQQQTPAATPPHATISILPGALRVGDTTIPLVEKTVTFSRAIALGKKNLLAR